VIRQVPIPLDKYVMIRFDVCDGLVFHIEYDGGDMGPYHVTVTVGEKEMRDGSDILLRWEDPEYAEDRNVGVAEEVFAELLEMVAKITNVSGREL